MVSKFSSLLAIATVAISSIAAQAPTTNLINGQCVQTYDPNVDYFPEKLNTADDKGQYFSIEYHNNYKVVKNSRTGGTYVLVQCGTPSPTGFGNDTEIYQVPITKAAAVETTVVPYLEMIGAAETLTLIADGSLVASPCFQKYLNSGKITDLSTSNVTLQEEQLKSVQVQFGTLSTSTSTSSSDKADNNTVSTAQTYEPDVLGRASWISYYAAFYNLEAVANNVTQTMITNYNKLKDAASAYDQKPIVAWTTYDAPSQYNNNTASYILSEASYKVGLTHDAGATMLNSSTLTFTSSADLLNAIKNVDVLIDETFIGSNLTAFLKNYNIPENEQNNYKFIANKKVYREDGVLTASGGYSWFEAPVAMADALLEDMINAVNPTAPSKNYQRKWLRNIVLDEPIKTTTQDNCTWNEDEPRPNIATQYNGDGSKFTLPSSSSSAANSDKVARTFIGALAISAASILYLL